LERIEAHSIELLPLLSTGGFMPKDIPVYDQLETIGKTRIDATIALANSDPLLIRRGLVDGASLVHKFGRNAAVPNGSWDGVLQLSGQFPWLQAATKVRIKAGGNAADDFGPSPQGTGAWAVTVQGLTAAGIEATENLTAAGASASASSTIEFIRVYRAWVPFAGSYTGSNTGNMVIEDEAGSTDLIMIAAGEGQSQFAGYTIPAGKVAYLASVMVQADAAKAADFRLMTRENANDVTVPFSAKRLKFFWDGILGASVLKPFTPILALNAWTDIWIEARGGGAGTEVSADFELIVYDV